MGELLPTNVHKITYFYTTTQIFTAIELEQITSMMEHHGRNDFALLIKFLAETGFRIGQALTLQWSDIEDGMIFRKSKNKARHESFPITTSIAQILQEIKKYHGKDDTKIFAWSATSASSLTRDLKIYLDLCGIEKNHRNFHAIRKTAATRWAEQGIPLQEVQKLLGHTHIETTNNYYVGVNMEKLRQKLEMSSIENLSRI